MLHCFITKNTYSLFAVQLFGLVLFISKKEIPYDSINCKDIDGYASKLQY